MKKYLVPLLVIGLGMALAATPRNALVEIIPDVPATLDPSQAYDTGSGQLVENVYDQLLGYKGADIKTLVPLLATEYKASNAAKTWTFGLRKNVKF